MTFGGLVHELLNDMPLAGTIPEQTDLWPFLSGSHLGTSLSYNAQTSGAPESSDLSEGSNASSELPSPPSVVGSHLAASIKLAYDSTQRDSAELSASPPTDVFSASASHASPAFPLLTIPTRRPSILGPRLSIPSRRPLAGINSPDSPASPITRVVDLTQQIRTLSVDAITHGGFADIYWGEWERRSEDGPATTVRMPVL
jgi:hypothetical protein